jgi:hypothetical protein
VKKEELSFAALCETFTPIAVKKYPASGEAG